MSENKNNEFFYFFSKKENQQGSSLSTPASKTLPRQNGPTFSQVKRLENPDVGTCFCFLDTRCRYLIPTSSTCPMKICQAWNDQCHCTHNHKLHQPTQYNTLSHLQERKTEISWRRNQPCHRPEQIPTANRRSSRAAQRSIPVQFSRPEPLIFQISVLVRAKNQVDRIAIDDFFLCEQ